VHPFTKAALAAVLAASAPLLGCASRARSTDFRIDVPRGLELYAPVPEGSVLTKERIELGEKLFSDPLLSADRTVACASCHRPDNAFSDAVPVSPGVYGRLGVRNTPTLLNVAYARHLTWDGRSSTLEEQVLKPIQDPVEMDLSLEELVRRLESNRAYRGRFVRAFGKGVSSEGVSLALAAFLRTLRSGDSPLDRFRTTDPDVLSLLERQGFQLFVGKARCAFCHAGPTLSDGEFHNTGVSARSGSSDAGRFARTGDESQRGAFRTPTLRNVAGTAPYMHDGSLATLEEVIEFYDGGGETNPNLDRDLRPLKLTEDETWAILAFLRALGGA
jgi:cytochrome c peroxidase